MEIEEMQKQIESMMPTPQQIVENIDKKMNNPMTDSQYLDKALDFIVEREQSDDYICELLHEIPEEGEICRNDCQGLNRICVLKFLKYYKKGCEE
jgi:hypothetical protein